VKKPLIILNPAARSEKAGQLIERIRRLVDRGVGAEIRMSTTPGESEKIAADGVKEGFNAIIAAGGDGTINEVVNGIAVAVKKSHGHGDGDPDVRLGILPVGTMNVFAFELGIPLYSLEKAWEIIERGTLRWLDLPRCSTSEGARYFVQLAGVGLDAEVVQRTTRESKKALGPLSYLLSLAQVVGNKAPEITITTGERTEHRGSFVLLGNGRFYGGPFKFFRNGSPSDGLLDVLVFHNQSAWDLLRYMHAIMIGQHADLRDVDYFQTASLEMISEEPVPYELDGELTGILPISFSLERHALPVFVPTQCATN